MRVIQQQLSGELANVVRVFNLILQLGDNRLQIQHGDGITVMGGAAQRLQYELQAIGIAIAGDLALV